MCVQLSQSLFSHQLLVLKEFGGGGLMIAEGIIKRIASSNWELFYDFQNKINFLILLAW